MLKYPQVGITVGFILSETTLDSKGRIVIPEEVRRELGLGEGSRIRVRVEDDSVIIKKSVDSYEFIRRTEGFLKEASRVKAEDPLRLKRIWQGQ